MTLSKTTEQYVRGFSISALALMVTVLAGCGGGEDGGSSSGSTNTVSGTIEVPLFNVADSDTNDENSIPVANSTLATAQSVPNPSTIGGYVNTIGSGDAGNSMGVGDRDDYFKVSLKQDQQVLLSIASSFDDGNDLDLFLYDSNFNEVAFSVGTNNYESMTVPSDGDYYVNVWALAGSSNYSLTIGLNQINNTNFTHASSESEFVAGEVIAKLKPSVTTRSLSTASAQLTPKLGNAGEAQLFTLESIASPTTRSLATVDPVAAKIAQGTTPEQQEKLKTLYAIKDLAARGDVEYAHPNYIKKTMLTPNDEFYSLQWHYPLMNLPAAWDITTGSRDVIVAVIDSGVWLDHVDLQGQLIGGYDFISDASRARDGNGIDSNPNDEGDLGAGAQGSSFHGTHVAGTVSAATNNETGVAGVSWNTSIMPIRVTGVGGGTDFDIAQGILFAAGLPNASGSVPPRRADIINLSLGGPDQGQTLTTAITQARNEGVIIIAAAGNSGKNERLYPASQEGVVSVSALDANRELAPYSTYGSTVDITAPGGNLRADVGGDGRPDGVLSTLVDDQGNSLIGYYNGTSMAAPHVAGVAALMKSVAPGLTPDQFDTLLRTDSLTQDLGTVGRDNLYGWGLMDARKAVEAAQVLAGGTISLPAASLGVNPSSLNFGAAIEQINVVASNLGSGDLSLYTVSENVSWMSVTAGQASSVGEGLGVYRIQVDRSGLDVGVYSANITFTSDQNQVVVPVIMQVLAEEVAGDLGRLYTLLIDAESGEVVNQITGISESGEYPFAFNDLPDGNYNVVVGTDMNNDGFICDDGEACGAYPTLDQPEDIDVSSSVSGLNFVAGFLASMPTSQSSQGEEKSVLLQSLESGKGFELLRK